MPAETQMSLGFRPRWAAWLTLAVCTAAVAIVLVVPGLSFSHHSVTGFVALQTVACVAGGLVAYLFYGRAQRSGSLAEELLAAALALLALGTTMFSLLPAMFEGGPSAFEIWAPVLTSSIAAALIALAAFVPDRRDTQPAKALRRRLIEVVGLVAILAASAATWQQRISPDSEALRGVGSLAAVLWGAAAFGFVRRAERTPEDLLTWLGIGLVFSAFARVYAVGAPTAGEEITPANVFELCFYGALLWGASREIKSYQRRLTEAAVFQERRRMARDLHDGLAQELAYISSQARRLSAAGEERRGRGRRASDRIVEAAERALEESRMAIAALTRPADEPLDASLAAAARSLGERSGVEVVLSLDSGVRVTPEVRESLLRVLREAMLNAARHGGASRVDVLLEGAPSLRLVVRDDGAGFVVDGDGGRPDSFGLVSMRERVENLGGRFALHSAPGEGTSVEVIVP